MRTITLEEHFVSPGFLNGPGRELIEQSRIPHSPITGVLEELQDVSEKRIRAMDAAGIDVQVLSLNSPGTEQLDSASAERLAYEANDFVADAVQKYPSRFSAFATLPTINPSAAVAELDRTVKDYGFKGALINGHVNGRYLDDKFFWPIFEHAQFLNVPIYLHPTQSPKSVVNASYSGFSGQVDSLLAGAGWGWHIETGTHILRLILGGVFDQYPKLQIIVGHLGEGLPFMMQRFDSIMKPSITGLNRPISNYLRENVSYTFSGFNFTTTFINLMLEVGSDRIMFSTDYPYGAMTKARVFLDNLPISNADKNRIAFGNAERLLNI